MSGYDGVKVFTATKALEREHLGEKVTAWIERHRDCVIVDTTVCQSSDQQFHCLSIVIFYRNK
ncbi:MAG: hypothetical protein KC620_22300 [Myxococcales bacterium]|nr:hypothetical protein [Myxococcales bacterium]